jgi:hypothetical protein
LDPHWIEGETNAGKVLSALQKDRFAVEQYYIRACVTNPNSWHLRYEAGMLFIVPPLDPEMRVEYSKRAVFWFNGAKQLLKEGKQQTVSVKNQINYIENLVGKLALESGYYDTADEMLWLQAHDPDTDEILRTNAAREWLSARSQRMSARIQKKLDEFKQKNGAAPSNLTPVLESLKDDPLIHDIDAYGFKWDYNAKEGKVSSRGVKARRTILAHAVVNSLLDLYRGSHNGKAPKDLIELQQFAWQNLKDTSAGVVEAIGSELNVIITPLGTPWQYDPLLGKVELPPICALDVLFRNADIILKSQK